MIDFSSVTPFPEEAHGFESKTASQTPSVHLAWQRETSCCQSVRHWSVERRDRTYLRYLALLAKAVDAANGAIAFG